MPDEYRISELPNVSDLNNDDLIEVSQVSPLATSGFVSLKAKITDLANKIINGVQFTSALTTTSKTVIGAVNEVNAKTDNDISHYTGTPTAGSTAEAIGNCATKSYVDNGTTPTVTITGKTGVGVWNVISTPIVRGGAVNIVMFFEVTGGGLPTVTHNISCTRTISKLDMIAVNLDSTNTVRTGSYDNGTIKFNNTLGNGKYLAIGTLLFT